MVYSVTYCYSLAKDFTSNHCFASFGCFSFYLQSLNSLIQSPFSEILPYTESMTQFFNFKRMIINLVI